MSAEDKTLKQLEREMDIATLAFWETIEAKDAANAQYLIAEVEMRRAKSAYLKAKLARDLLYRYRIDRLRPTRSRPADEGDH